MLLALIKAMRPRQWIKNGVIFAALVFDRQLGLNNMQAMLRTAAGFAIFCLLSGAVYIINDIADVDADRKHPKKSLRPIASGKLPIPVAYAAAAALLLVIFPLAYLLSPWFALVALAYLLLNLAYSKWLKHITIIDVFAIALGFVLRVAAGITLIHVARFSPWLYVVTTMGSLFIGFGKRRAELSLLSNDANLHRKVLDGYTIPLLDEYITIVLASTILSYSLYTFSAPNLPDNHVMMLTIPFVLYGVFRYLQLVQMKAGGGAPEEIFLADRPMQLTILLWGASILLIFYIF
ncbi:MAG: decaprenyl-phosphate phosphoribosyltransferase [Anaerolineales bacterium]|nr:decaprenyl-phosphate phosphoribosyltransferase [Anaerolineales bacterium]